MYLSTNFPSFLTGFTLNTIQIVLSVSRNSKWVVADGDPHCIQLCKTTDVSLFAH